MPAAVPATRRMDAAKRTRSAIFAAAVLLAPAGALPAAAQTAGVERAYRPELCNTDLQACLALGAAGNVDAQVHLGFIYDLALGVPEDNEKAARWYRLAAAQGDTRAQTKLGDLYSVGAGVPKDQAEAVRWYRLAAERGDAFAQTELGKMYGAGSGVPEDMVQAYAWWLVADRQDSPGVEGLLKLAVETMTPAQIAEAEALSRKYWDLYVRPYR